MYLVVGLGNPYAALRIKRESVGIVHMLRVIGADSRCASLGNNRHCLKLVLVFFIVGVAEVAQAAHIAGNALH